MFKGVQPAGQPRTIRSIIAKYNDASNFPPDTAPEAPPQAKENWPGPAPTPRREGAASKTPFK
jgi:hypothetical protein